MQEEDVWEEWMKKAKSKGNINKTFWLLLLLFCVPNFVPFSLSFFPAFVSFVRSFATESHWWIVCAWRRIKHQIQFILKCLCCAIALLLLDPVSSSAQAHSLIHSASIVEHNVEILAKSATTTCNSPGVRGSFFCFVWHKDRQWAKRSVGIQYVRANGIFTKRRFHTHTHARARGKL